MTIMDLHVDDRSDIPLYRRIADSICDAVAAGRLQPGQKLPPHLGLSRLLGVSPLTVSRGYEVLAERGIVRQKVGSGTYLQPDALQRIRTVSERSIETLWFVLGETALTRCKRETLFWAADVLDGLHGALGGKDVRITYLENLTRQEPPRVGDQDAVIVLNPRRLDRGYVQELLARGIPMLALGATPALHGIPSVSSDRRQAASLACKHLIQEGYRRIGFIGTKDCDDAPVSSKYYVYCSLLHKAGLDLCAAHVRDVRPDFGRAYVATVDMIEGGDLPEAIFVDTDYKAIEVMLALQNAGLRIPQDVAVVSYDDVAEAESCSPPLTTVHVPRREVGYRAGRMLLSWPADHVLPDDVVVPSRLVVRESSRRIASTRRGREKRPSAKGA